MEMVLTSGRLYLRAIDALHVPVLLSLFVSRLSPFPFHSSFCFCESYPLGWAVWARRPGLGSGGGDAIIRRR